MTRPKRFGKRASRIRCAVCGERSGATGSLEGTVHRWGPVGHAFEPRPADTLRGAFRDDYDSFDAWASVMSAFFDVAGILYNRGDDIPADWGFRPGLGEVETSESYLAEIAIETDSDVLRDFGNILSRYADKLRVADRDY